MSMRTVRNAVYQTDGETRSTYLREPASDVIPPHSHDVTPLERPPASVVASPVTQECAIAEAQVLYKRGIADFDVECRLEIRRAWGIRVCISADKAFISFSNNPCLTSSVGSRTYPFIKKTCFPGENERGHT
jgi:hypothetical protein